MLLDVLPVFAHAGPAVARRLIALRREVRLVERHAVDRHATERVYIDALARQPDDPLDERLAGVVREPEDDDVAALDRLEVVFEFVDEDALLVFQARLHRGAL